MAKTEIEVGRGLRDAASDVAAVWKAAEAGDVVVASDRIYFRDWASLCAVLTSKRFESLRHVRQSPVGGIPSLARALDRDVEEVQADVTALADLGLLTLAEDGALSSKVDEIASIIRIAA